MSEQHEHRGLLPVDAEYFTGPTSSTDNGFRTVPGLLRQLANWMDDLDIQDPEVDALNLGLTFTEGDDFYQHLTLYYRAENDHGKPPRRKETRPDQPQDAVTCNCASRADGIGAMHGHHDEKCPKSQDAVTRQLAEKIADDLFRNGQGHEADRLVLMKDNTDTTGRDWPKDLGGWCKSAVVDRIAAALTPDARGSGEAGGSIENAML